MDVLPPLVVVITSLGTPFKLLFYLLRFRLFPDPIYIGRGMAGCVYETRGREYVQRATLATHERSDESADFRSKVQSS